jgi:sugar-specific transcriptional regulator TrmB
VAGSASRAASLPILIKPYIRYASFMDLTVAERLQMFGVDERQADLYLKLLKQGPKTLGQLVELFGKSRTDLLDALSGLREKRMVKESADHPPKFSALPIETALDAAVMKQAHDLRRMELLKEEVIDLVNSRFQQDYASDLE